MLQIIGKCLDITEEIVREGTPDAFVSTRIHLLSGTGANTSIERIRVGRDFPKNLLPKKDEDVTLHVVVSAYAGRNGASYNLTALGRIHPASRPVAAAS